MSDLGTQGGKEAAPLKEAAEGGTPKTGFDSAPKGEFATYYTREGIGGTGRGAH